MLVTKHNWELRLAEDKKSAEFYCNGLKCGPIFTASTPVITGIVMWSTYGHINDETQRKMMSDMVDNKMPSINPGMPSLQFGWEVAGMVFSTTFCEINPFQIFYKAIKSNPFLHYHPKQKQAAIA